MKRDASSTLVRLAPPLPIDRDGLERARSRVHLTEAVPAGGLEPIRPTRTSRRRWLLLASGVAAAAAVSVAVSTSTAPPAFASWTAVPTRPSATAAATAVDSCDDAAVGGAPTPIITEARGEVVMVLLVDASWTAVCLWSEADQGSVTGSTHEEGPPPSGGGVTLTTQLSAWSAGDGDWTAVYGRVGPDVSRLVVERGAGEPVTATVQDGRFAAWWPGTADATTITTYGADGLPQEPVRTGY